MLIFVRTALVLPQPQASSSILGPKSQFREAMQLEKNEEGVGSREGVGAHRGGQDCSHSELHQLQLLCNHSPNTCAYQILPLLSTGNAVSTQLGKGRNMWALAWKLLLREHILQSAGCSHSLSTPLAVSNWRVVLTAAVVRAIVLRQLSSALSSNLQSFSPETVRLFTCSDVIQMKSCRCC